MKIFDHPLYKEDLRYVASLNLPWDKLAERTLLLSGGTGLIGSFLVDVLMLKNEQDSLNCKVIAIGRNLDRAKDRFAGCWESQCFEFVRCDINEGFDGRSFSRTDYVIHLASNTHPVAYATEPVSTIMTNVIGTRNMLELARRSGAKRFAFASSNEVYGENRGDAELFDEKYSGYIDSNTLRAGYPESKRCGETLCQAYARQYGMDVVIPRFTRSYGPTLLPSDTKALSQFLRNGLAGENIVLKSEGNQYYSYTYEADAVAGLLTVLLKGECGEAYNIADEPSDIRLKDLARTIADICGTEVVFELPDEVERAGFSKATKARLDGSKLKRLGWSMRYDIPAGVERTITVLKDE